MGHDPELGEIPTSGMPVCNVRIATNDGYKDRNTGEFVERATWHRVTFFGRAAEVIAEYGAKGRSIFVAGRTRKEKYEDDNGNERESVDVIAKEWRFTGPSTNGSSNGNGQSTSPSSNDYDDDIPF
jgi:single-strand DNA-binding protein